MKKLIKLLSVVFIVCLICVSFSGCDKITKMKTQQGFYDKDGNIVLDDDKYMKLSSVLTADMYIDSDKEQCFITKEDVPVLLSASEGTPFNRSKDGIFLSAVHDVEIYCRSDKLEEMEKKLSSPHNYTKLMYSYDMYSDDAFDFNFETKNRILTDEEATAIAKVMNESAPVNINNIDSLIESNYWYTVSIYSATDDLLFRKFEFDIYRLEDGYFIKTEEKSDKPAVIFSVPKELNGVFDTITKEYKDYMG